MAYTLETGRTTGKSELVISGFENGIADSPYEGLADVRNCDILSSPKQATVNFANAAITLPPSGYSGTSFSADATTDVITVASTAGFYMGMALTISSVSGAGGITNGRTYYVANITSTSFKLYDSVDITGSAVDVTVGITGTFTVYTFGTPTDSVSGNLFGRTIDQTTGFEYLDTFIMTSNGYVWRITTNDVNGPAGMLPKNTLQFMGNTGHSTEASLTQTGMAIWNGYLLAFMGSKIDYLSGNTVAGGANPSATWVYAWKNISVASQGHRALSALDDGVYFCNGSSVGSILVNAGSTFDPATSSTYTFNTTALKLPYYEDVTCLAQLGTQILVGGSFNYVYSWDRISTSYNYPIIVAESYIKCIVSTNSSAYIFAGNRGRIYLTNGSNVDLFKKVPDSITNTVKPYFTWGWAMYLKNQLYFTMSATTNGLSAINTLAGVWAIDLDTKALRMTSSLSTGTYGGTVPVLIPMGHVFPTGDGIYSGWINANTTGLDYTSGTPYQNFEARIDSDIIPIGTFYDKRNYTSVEFKLSRPMVSGEKIRLSWRANLTDAFTVIGTTQTTVLSNALMPNFINLEWLQIRAEYSSTSTNPTYVPLMQIRIRE